MKAKSNEQRPSTIMAKLQQQNRKIKFLYIWKKSLESSDFRTAFLFIIPGCVVEIWCLY